MHGLLTRSLPSPIPYHPWPEFWLCSLFCGDLRRLSPGRLCCSLKYLWPELVAMVSFPLAAAYLWAPAFVVPSVLG